MSVTCRQTEMDSGSPRKTSGLERGHVELPSHLKVTVQFKAENQSPRGTGQGKRIHPDQFSEEHRVDEDPGEVRKAGEPEERLILEATRIQGGNGIQCQRG